MFDLNGKGTVTFGTFVLVILLQGAESNELLLITLSLICQIFIVKKRNIPEVRALNSQEVTQRISFSPGGSFNSLD